MSFRRVGHLPMIIVVGLGKDDYLADWRAEVVRAFALASLFACVIVLFAVQLYRSWRSREADVDALELQERKFRTLLESSPDGLVIADADGVITLVNRNAELMFGYTAADLVGQPISVLLPARYSDLSLVTEIARESGHATSNHDLWAVTKDGREFPVGISVSSINTDQGGLIAAAIRDMTERHASASHIEFLARHDALVAGRSIARMEPRFGTGRGRRGACRHARRADVAGPGQLQDRQRLARPSHWRRVAERQSRCALGSSYVRQRTSSGRHGGDEFLNKFTGLVIGADLPLAADRLVQDFTTPFLVDGHEIASSLSVGHRGSTRTTAPTSPRC